MKRCMPMKTITIIRKNRFEFEVRKLMSIPPWRSRSLSSLNLFLLLVFIARGEPNTRLRQGKQEFLQTKRFNTARADIALDLEWTVTTRRGDISSRSLNIVFTVNNGSSQLPEPQLQYTSTAFGTAWMSSVGWKALAVCDSNAFITEMQFLAFLILCVAWLAFTQHPMELRRPLGDNLRATANICAC